MRRRQISKRLAADNAPAHEGINDIILFWHDTVARRAKDWQNAVRPLFLKEAVSLIRCQNALPLRIPSVAS